MTRDIVQIISALHGFVAKLLLLLEHDLATLSTHGHHDTIVAGKNITHTLNKLVNVIVQLKKLSDSEDACREVIINEKDQVIIENFLKNYRHSKLI